MNITRRLGSLAAATLLTGTAAIVAPSAQAAPSCGIHWGSLPKAAGTLWPAAATGLRAGKHPCFDRLVLDVSGEVKGYSVRYVDEVTQDGSGFGVPLAGGAKLQVTAYAGGTRRLASPSTRGYRTFRQVTWAGSFEGYTTVGVGVRARLPFRVFVLDGPGSGSRLVVDVAHRW